RWLRLEDCDMMLHRGRTFLVLTMLVTACAGAGAPRTDRASGSDQVSQPVAGSKAITMALDEDLRNLWNVVTEGSGGSEAKHFVHTFHQPLAANVSDGSAVPRVLQELPSVERGTWKVFDDGSMETTWRLRS